MDHIDEIKARIDIVDLVSESGVQLRRSGRNHTGFCPFHSNTKTPAFVVWQETGSWKCFGECNDGGDIFKFVMKKEGMDFKDALRHLADKAGVKLQEYTPEQTEQRESADHLRTLLEEIALFYHQQLKTPAGANTLSYLREKRGLTDDTIEAFLLGYSPNGWDNVLKHFTERGYSVDDLMDAGMLSQNDQGRRYDRFRDRLMIPIRDARGRMAGFGARTMDPDGIPKYLNSPQTVLFDKGHMLFGLDRAKKAIRTLDQAVIVEGYMDVIAPHQAGFENVISPMGTALTEDQLRLLKRYTAGNHIVLALDPDAAGQKAILRGLDAARKSLDREGELAFDARGFLRHEARLQADLRVANLPDELDPDEIVLRNPAEWEALIKNAKPIVTHVMESLAEGRDIDDAKVKTDIATQVLPLIADLPNPIERETFRQQLARMLRVDERALIGGQQTSIEGRGKRKQDIRRAPSQVMQTQRQVAGVAVVNPTKKMEAYSLSILVQQPDLLFRLDRALQEIGLQPLHENDFGYTENQSLFKIIRAAIAQDALEAHEFVQEEAGEVLAELLARLQTEADNLSSVIERVLEEMVRSIISLRRLRIADVLNQLRFFQEDAQERGDDIGSDNGYQALVMQQARLRRDLDEAQRRLSQRRLE
jgi:DNA primase